MVDIKGCHLVGSVPLEDSEAVFRQCLRGMPNRLKRIPDGETGSRNYFTYWQSNVFTVSPLLMTKFVNNAPIQHADFTDAELEEGIALLKAARPLKTGYDDVAIASYGVFKKLRDEGVVPPGTKFQVSLPTVANIIAPFVQYAFQAAVEPIYEEALFRAIRNIQDAIHHDQLSIQVDLAVDTLFWEGLDMYKPWFSGDVKGYIVDYTARMLAQVDADVEVGLHNCYGDMEHRHYMEPTSLAVIVERALRVIEKTPHPLDYIHMPVPRSALDKLDDYYAPLARLLPKLKEHNTELLLGCVHYDDRPATQKMIEAAKRVPGMVDFGVASECGWGRTPPGEIENIMQISSEVSQPVL